MKKYFKSAAETGKPYMANTMVTDRVYYMVSPFNANVFI